MNSLQLNETPRGHRAGGVDAAATPSIQWYATGDFVNSERRQVDLI